ncbi:MAG: serine/threonine protein kinase [Planctomycetales bacterium]|nr:serine/threonine protein kinase [Planctomycetales bacterium]
MRTPTSLFKVIAKYMLNSACAGLPVGDFVVDVIPDMARDVWERWSAETSEDERKAEITQIAAASSDELRPIVESVVSEVAGDKSEEVKRTIRGYLEHVPAQVRRTLRRESDKIGKTVPRDLCLRSSQDLVPFLPPSLPRFKPGDRPLPGVDLELEELLGVGGFGEVWKAKNYHLPNGSAVALKFCIDDKAATNLRNEVDLLNRVMESGTHPGIIKLRHTYLNADPPCLEYELVPDGDLAGFMKTLFRRQGGPTPHQVAILILQVADTVSTMHALHPSIVHRDLKPSNILVELTDSGEPCLRIGDFGIGGIVSQNALDKSRKSDALAVATAWRGAYTPLYASSEQKLGRPPTPSDDVHAIGVIWFQLLIGDLTAGVPTGRQWMSRLQALGMDSRQVDLIAQCLESESQYRLKDAMELAQRIRELYFDRAEGAFLVARPDESREHVRFWSLSEETGMPVEDRVRLLNEEVASTCRKFLVEYNPHRMEQRNKELMKLVETERQEKEELVKSREVQVSNLQNKFQNAMAYFQCVWISNGFAAFFAVAAFVVGIVGCNVSTEFKQTCLGWMIALIVACGICVGFTFTHMAEGVSRTK